MASGFKSYESNPRGGCGGWRVTASGALSIERPRSTHGVKVLSKCMDATTPTLEKLSQISRDEANVAVRHVGVGVQGTGRAVDQKQLDADER